MRKKGLWKKLVSCMMVASLGLSALLMKNPKRNLEKALESRKGYG